MEIDIVTGPSNAPVDRQDAVRILAESTAPLISVIVPVRNSPRELRQCLMRLFASTFTDYEVVVVDDASTDESVVIAEILGARVLRLDKRCGPAQARNRGADVACGKYLFFLDADVCVYPDTLQHIADTFAQSPDLDAVFGSYDTQPNARNVLSQYRNLFHHFVHQHGNEEATTFWSGCGAMRRSVFLHMGGFSTRYHRPAIEDIELGRRLHKAGHRILLDKGLQVTHLKRWTLWSMIKTDVLHRGMPWTELMLREGSMPNDLNLKVSQRISVGLAYGLLVIFGIGVWYYRQLLYMPLFLLALISALDYWSTRRRFYPMVRILMAFTGLAMLAIIGHMFQFWPLFPLALLVGIVAINFRFYQFFFREHHMLLMSLVLPLHLLYYLYCGLALGLGILLHLWKTRIGRWFARAAVPELVSKPKLENR